MADFSISVARTSPVSVTVSWPVGTWPLNGPRDYSVYLKTNTPTSQGYRLYGKTQGSSLLISDLNWTTQYWVYVVASVGTSKYTSEVARFLCQCGQAFLYVSISGSPVDVYQQSVDISSGQVAMTGNPTGAKDIYLYRILNDADWTFLDRIEGSRLYGLPWLVRYVYGRIVGITNPIYKPPQVFSRALYGATTFLALDSDHQSSYGLAVNGAGRVVALTWGYSGGEYKLYSNISYDWGRSFSDPVEIESGDLTHLMGVVYEEHQDRSIWFAYPRLDEGVYKLAIYRYVIGETPELKASLGSSLYTGYSYMDFNEIGIGIEGSKIVVSFTQSNKTYIAISTDNGANWDVKLVTTAKQSINYVGPVVISNGIIVLFTYKLGTGYYALHRSTDDGDTWAVVVTFDATYHLPYFQFTVMRSDGSDIVFTSCEFSLYPSPPNNIGYLISHDSGATWDFVEAPDSIEAVLPL